MDTEATWSEHRWDNSRQQWYTVLEDAAKKELKRFYFTDDENEGSKAVETSQFNAEYTTDETEYHVRASSNSELIASQGSTYSAAFGPSHSNEGQDFYYQQTIETSVPIDGNFDNDQKHYHDEGKIPLPKSALNQPFTPKIKKVPSAISPSNRYWKDFLQWIPADGLSAAVVAHHLQYRNTAHSAEDESCKRMCCDRGLRQFSFSERSTLVLYIREGKRSFMINLRGGALINEDLRELRQQSQKYAAANSIQLEGISLMEFQIADWINGKDYEDGGSKYSPEIGTTYAGGIVCPRCKHWNPFGVRCLKKSCQARIESLDKSFSATGAIGARAIEALVLHPGEDAGFALGGIAVMGIIGMFLLGGTLGGT